MDWAVIACILTIINIFSVFYAARLVGQALSHGLSDLDKQLAAAISSLLSSGFEGLEPPNPIQGAIAQFITQRLAQTPISGDSDRISPEIIRDMAGKFS